jgi:hypothetical protein
MVKRGLGRRWSQESEQLRRIERTCMRNLLYSTEERVYFKDLRSRDGSDRSRPHPGGDRRED